MVLPDVKNTEYTPTHDYLQDVSRVIGKFQQQFVKEQPHEWHRGLCVVERGFESQLLKIGGKSLAVNIDLRVGQLQVANFQWSLGEGKPEVLRNLLQEWLVDNGVNKKIPKPEYNPAPGQYAQGQSIIIAQMLYWAKQQLEEFKTTLRGKTSPILLFPHHFDLSLVLFLNESGDTDQMNYGFSGGDATISEPYFYITAYPEPAGFTGKTLIKPAFWQKKDFSGAILLYKDVVRSNNPSRTVHKFLRSF